MKEYKTEKINIKDIKLDGDNPNKLDPDMDKRLGQSMKEFGNTQDIVVDKNTMILADGEHRLKQYKKEGLAEIPVKLIPFKSDAHRRAYRQAANKIRGKHTDDLDAQEYMKIIEAGEKDLLKMATGLSIGDVEKHLRRQNLLAKEEDFDADEEYKKIEEPITKLGDIWKLGESRLMCGDATNSEQVGILMADEKADMVFTDPPYGVDYSGKNEFLNKIDKGNRIQKDMIQDDIKDMYSFLFETFKNIKNNLKETNSIYITFAGSTLRYLLNSLNDLDFKIHQILVWVKNNHVLGRVDYASKHELIVYGWFGKHKFYGGFQPSVWEIDKPLKSELHPIMKPIELCERAINNSSKEDMVVLDVFGGSGSTLIACEKLERRCYMMEIDPIYCDVIIKRWEEFTNLKAEKIL